MPVYKQPPVREAERCIELRKRTKRGETISEEDFTFVHQMYRTYRMWYRATEKRVFDETVPFGSQAKRKE